MIIQTLQIVMNGDGVMGGKRTVGDIKGNSFGSNTNIQGDYVSQSNIKQKTEIQSALNDLEQKIKLISDEKSKEDVSLYFDMLLKYIEENKPTKIEKCLTKIKEIIGVTASMLTIASKFGVTL